MSPPAPVPGHRARTDPRTVIIAVIVGALTLGVVVVGGRLIAGDVNYAVDQAVERLYYEPPSDQWVSGAVQQWSTTIDPEASIFTSPDHLFSVKTAGDNAQASTLTAYTMDGSGLSQAWTATVDTSADSVAEITADNNPKIYPSFLVWGKNTLIHGGTLYDITTGTTSDAPWPADAVPVVVKNEDMVIACQQSTCAGYHEGSTEPAWSSIVHDAVSGLPTQTLDAAARITKMAAYNYTGLVSMAGSRYAIIARHYVINIDTGEVLSFSVPDASPAIYNIGYSDDEWLITSTYYDVLANSTRQWHLSLYGPAGGEPTSTQDMLSPSDTTYPLHYPGTPTEDDYLRMFIDNDYSTLAGSKTSKLDDASKKDCLQKIDMSSGTTIDLSGLDKNAFPCFDRDATSVSSNAKVVTVGMKQVTNATPFSLMYNTTTGEQVTFEGMDPSSGAAFTTVGPEQIIGYSPADGTLISYAPGSPQ